MLHGRIGKKPENTGTVQSGVQNSAEQKIPVKIRNESFPEFSLTGAKPTEHPSEHTEEFQIPAQTEETRAGFFRNTGFAAKAFCGAPDRKARITRVNPYLTPAAIRFFPIPESMRDVFGKAGKQNKAGGDFL